MSLTNFDAYKNALKGAWQRVNINKASLAATAGVMQSLWTSATVAGGTPSTAVAPDRTTTGAIGQFNGGSNKARAWLPQVNALQDGTLILCDRLSHQGGLSGTVTTAQTTNLATAALTRYTSDLTVMAALEIYTQIGTTATTFTVSYTDQASGAGNTSNAQDIGATGRREVGRFLPITLASGDTGIKSVESVTVLASTGTAGNFGVTLYKPLLAIPLSARLPWAQESSPLLATGALAPEILDDACLFWLFAPTTSTTGAISGELALFEDDAA